MTSAERWLDRLAQLSRRDRDWLLKNLSASAKDNLRRRASASSDADPDAAEAAPALADERALDALDGGMVATGLAAEPSWVLAMILSVRAWHWEAQVLAKSAPVTRLEVSQLRGSLPRLSAAMSALVMRTLCSKLLGAGARESRFEHLLDRAQARSGPRL